MNHIQGLDRFQITFSSLEDQLDKENPVRIIDAFIDKLDLDLLGFVNKPLKSESQQATHSNPLDGRPSFELKSLLKLYFYGYFNGIRSSRRLQKECVRNIEVRWLLGNLTPNYHTIADFRKHNPNPLKNSMNLWRIFNLVGPAILKAYLMTVWYFFWLILINIKPKTGRNLSS